MTRLIPLLPMFSTCASPDRGLRAALLLLCVLAAVMLAVVLRLPAGATPYEQTSPVSPVTTPEEDEIEDTETEDAGQPPVSPVTPDSTPDSSTESDAPDRSDPRPTGANPGTNDLPDQRVVVAQVDGVEQAQTSLFLVGLVLSGLVLLVLLIAFRQRDQ